MDKHAILADRLLQVCRRCFGGRDQSITLAHCIGYEAKITASGDSKRRVRDVFAEAMGDSVAPTPFVAPQRGLSYEQQIIDMAATMETSM